MQAQSPYYSTSQLCLQTYGNYKLHFYKNMKITSLKKNIGSYASRVSILFHKSTTPPYLSNHASNLQAERQSKYQVNPQRKPIVESFLHNASRNTWKTHEYKL